MGTAVKPVQNGRGRKRWWPDEQKLAVLQEWKNGVPLESDGADPLPHATTEPGVERLGGSVLRQLQAGLRVPGVSGDVGACGASGAAVDRALQPARATQRLGDAGASRVLCGMESQKQDAPCPKVGGAVEHFS